VTGNQMGQFTLWNGCTFNFESLKQVNPLGTAWRYVSSLIYRRRVMITLSERWHTPSPALSSCLEISQEL
jgi:hypothetical protein